MPTTAEELAHRRQAAWECAAEHVPPRVDERHDEPLALSKPEPTVDAARAAGGDALADDGQLEQREGLVPVGVGDVESGLARVALDHLGARREPRPR